MPLEAIELLCNRFHLIARKIRKKYNNRETIDINDEYDVQDLFHSMLYIFLMISDLKNLLLVMLGKIQELIFY